MEYKNYSISTAKGKLYLKEKQATPGYIEVPYGTEGKTTFHQYADSVKGLPKILEVKEILYEGKTLKFLELTLIDGETANKVSVSLKNPKGNYSNETKALLSALNNLELGEEITLTPKSTTTISKTNQKEYKNLNIYINYVNRLGDNDRGLSTGFISYTDIPKPIEKIVAGDTVYDWSPQTEFFYSKLGELLAKFQLGGGTTSATKTENNVNTLPPQSATQAFQSTKNVKKEEFSDLPF
jgi:hypothetical protein